MKHFRVILLILLLLFLTRQTTTAQYQNFLDSLPKFEVIDSQIYQALDTVLFHTKECIFSILDRPYYFQIVFWDKEDKITVRVRTTPYYWSVLNSFKRETFKAKGFFYYKDYLVLVEDRSWTSQEAIYPLFLHKTDSIQALYYYTPNPRHPIPSKGGETAAIYYEYKNGILEEESRDICWEYPYYVYKIGESDTWESIAEKLRTTVEELQSIQEVYGEELPPVGTSIRFMYYRIGDGRMRIDGTWYNVLPPGGVIEEE